MKEIRKFYYSRQNVISNINKFLDYGDTLFDGCNTLKFVNHMHYSELTNDNIEKPIANNKFPCYTR